MILTYFKFINTLQLQQEICSTIPNLAPINNIALVLIETAEDYCQITVPDDILPQDKSLLDSIISNHIALPEILEPDWSNLAKTLSASKPFFRVYTESKSKSSVTTPFSFLMDTLTTTHNINNLQFALNDIQKSLNFPFTKEEIHFLNKALLDNHFSIQLPFREDAPEFYIPCPDWVGLEKSLSNSFIFFKVFQLAKNSTPLNTIYTLVQDTVTSSRNEGTLQFALSDLKNTIEPKFTQAELDHMNNILIVNNFTIRI